ncbi:MAG: FtsX-like permease family protein, partial [Bacteroidaceae bacterium]|nr:FtsX-like permease family protein [Bacteroidaceae bacterium]
VAVGILVMIVSLCITIGFQHEIKNKAASLAGHIQVVNSNSLYDNRSLPIQIGDTLRDELASLPCVSHVQRFALCPAMLKTNDAFRGIMLRGVGTDFDSYFLSSHLVSGTVPSFGTGVAPSDSILLSARLASALELQVGDRVYAYFFDNNLRVRRFFVSGIFQTHMADFDIRLCYADIRVVQRLSRWESDQYSGAEIVLHDFNDMDTVSAILSSMFLARQDAYGQYYATPDIEERFPQVFSWLSLLDTNVIAILILMICVAGVTMVSGLLIIILERTRFIGIMKAMGTTDTQLRHLFLYLASMIVLRGMFWGNVTAFVFLVLQKATGIVALDPVSYYIDHVPVYFPWDGIVAVNIVTLAVCVLVLIVPTYIVSRIHPARSIRFE